MVGSRVGIQVDDENEFVENMEVWSEDSVIYAAGTRMPPKNFPDYTYVITRKMAARH